MIEYRIWCKVWGGVTGHRESWLKDNGKVRAFSTREAAAKVSRDLNIAAMSNPNRTAEFLYEVVEWWRTA
jgi:hypothetical protein